LLGFAFFATVLTGLVFKTLAIWITTRFAMMRAYSFSARLLENYLHQPYEWFLSRHSSVLNNAILNEVDKVVSGSLLPAMRVIPDSFTIVLIIIAVFLLEPGVAVGSGLLLGGIYVTIYLSARKTLRSLGREQLSSSQLRFQVSQEATGGTKELKLMGLEASFLDRFRAAALRLARAQTKVQVISSVPRQAIEATAFGGMIALVLFLLVRDGSGLAAIIPTLGLTAAAGLRIIPALQQLYQRAAAIKQSAASLEHIHSDLTSLPIDALDVREKRDSYRLRPLTQQLTLNGVQYKYPRSERSALIDVSITIEANTTVGIVGSSGAGKTTLVDILLGLLEPIDGSMCVDGQIITNDKLRPWQKTLGYVPQSIFLSEGTIAENIAFGRSADDIDRVEVERAARIASLHNFVISELPEGYETKVGERGVRLSGGQRQRIGIARALYHDPATLIFDEATSALDSVTENLIVEAVKRLAGRKTILMIAHRLSTVRDCDQIFLMREGRVADKGSYSALLARDKDFRRMAGELK